MKRGFLVLAIISLTVASVLAYTAKTGNKSYKKTKNYNLSDGQAPFPQRLKSIIMPAGDIIEQVRDVARAVAAGDTKPGLALSIYAKAEEYLKDTRVKIDEINVTGGAIDIKGKSDNIIKESVKNVEDLTYLTKTSNKEKLEKAAKELDSKLIELRRLLKNVPEVKK